MRSTLVCAVLAVSTTVASAQPGQQPYPAPPPQPAPYVPPPPQQQHQGYYLTPPNAYQPPLITADEVTILAKGEIEVGPHILGVASSYLIGFGSGQAIQGRWSDTGWIFTVGEVASVVAIIASIDQWADDDCAYYDDDCDDDEVPGLLIAGAVGWVAFRVWGMVDAVAGPISHNRKFRRVQQKVGGGYQYYGAMPYLAPAAKGDGGVAGVTFRF